MSLDSDSDDDRLVDLNNPLDRNNFPKPGDFTQNDLNQFFFKTLNTNLPDIYKNISFGKLMKNYTVNKIVEDTKEELRKRLHRTQNFETCLDKALAYRRKLLCNFLFIKI